MYTETPPTGIRWHGSAYRHYTRRMRERELIAAASEYRTSRRTLRRLRLRKRSDGWRRTSFWLRRASPLAFLVLCIALSWERLSQFLHRHSVRETICDVIDGRVNAARHGNSLRSPPRLRLFNFTAFALLPFNSFRELVEEDLALSLG